MLVQEVLELEMDETLGARKGQRTADRLGYRSGYYSRQLTTRVGTIELRVPQDRAGMFTSRVFDRYQRSEKALIAALGEMYIQGVSTRKVAAVTETLCGREFSASAVSAATKRLDKDLKAFAVRRLEEDYPYVMLDATYHKVREGGTVHSRAILIAIGIDREGRRAILAVEAANRESLGSWREFLLGLKERGLSGVEFVASDSHEGLRQAIEQTLPQAAWQRCYVHFLRNLRDHLPRKADEDCRQELRWLYDRRDLGEARRDLAAWIEKWQAKYPKAVDWAEENIEQTLTYYCLPQQHHKHMKSTNMLERFNEEIRRRARVLRIFPNEPSALRLIRALAVETHEDWSEGTRYLNMDWWREHKKEREISQTKAA
jgi:putative transposase